MSIKKIRQDLLRFLGNLLLYNAVAALCSTLKINIQNGKCVDDLIRQKKNFVLAFWHGSMLIPWYFLKNKDFAALVSRSKDGALLVKILEKWNYKIIRGSSNKGGSVALGILIDYAKNDSSIAITPDGPKGPYHKLKPGAVVIAKKAGIPLVLLGAGYQKKRELKSWDKFEIPKFFSRVNLVFSEPVMIDKDLSFEETAKIIEQCEIKLNQIQQEAGKF